MPANPPSRAGAWALVPRCGVSMFPGADAASSATAHGGNHEVAGAAVWEEKRPKGEAAHYFRVASGTGPREGAFIKPPGWPFSFDEP